MKIVLTGGGSGGHFYPILAVAQEIKKISREKKLLPPELYFFSTDPYDEKILFDEEIEFVRIPAGKRRLYLSPRNFFDLWKTGFGLVTAFFRLFSVYPDVVFGKGGYTSFPTLFAARILRIPVVIHESDVVPGRVNKWAAKFAKRIAVSFEEAGEHFPEEKVAYTGNPIREAVLTPARSGAREYLDLESNVPVILILGGSQGAQLLNETILEILPEMVKNYQVIHQTGETHFEGIKETARVVLSDSEYKTRYKPFGYLNDLALRMSAGAADLVVSRAGSGLFEVAAWGLPSIVIPITESHGNHQRKNAYAYARSGAAIVIEEGNLSPNILLSEMANLLLNRELMLKMSQNAGSFARLDAAKIIGEEIIEIALSHE